MITGYNANVRHRGRVFHVQTEDSGRLHPHVISHLYYEGTILASERRDYAELVGVPDLDARVRRLMEEQHAVMLERLQRGDFDGVIAARLACPGPASGVPAEMATPAAPRPAPAASSGQARALGEGTISNPPLDDVILEYLVAKARDRAGGGRGSRSEG